MAKGERILLVGAGAVGQVYGRHLQRGGATVAFYVRPKYAAELRKGVWMWPLNEGRAAVRFEGFEVLTTPDEVAARTWDQVWLCVSSPALRQGDWVERLSEATGTAIWLTLQPGMMDRDLLLGYIPAERLASGIITFIAWSAPLPGETLAPTGIMYWLPPLTPTPFAGPGAEALAASLRAGGAGARVVADLRTTNVVGEAVLLPAMAALESAGWTFAGFRRGDAPERAIAAIRESTAISAAYVETHVPWALKLLQPWVLRLATRLAPLLMPFDIETYLKYHFTKVGDQTLLALEEWIGEGKARGLPVAALERLQAAVTPKKS